MAIKLRLTPKQQQMAAGGAVILLVGGFAYFRYLWKPISARITEAGEKIEEVEGRITKAKSQAARLPQIQHELVVLNQQAVDAERRLPKAKDVPMILDTLSRLTRKYRVELKSLGLGAPSAKQYFIEVPYSISITGTYHDVGRFLAAVALEERIYNVRGLSLSGGGQTDQLSVSFTLVSYQYKT